MPRGRAFGAPPSGWRGDAWIGSQPQSNNPERSWGRYFAEQRVRPFVGKAVDVGHLAATMPESSMRVCDRISRGCLRRRPSARADPRRPVVGQCASSPREGAVLIDPAAHGGHGLTDLAMLDLFGCPGLEQVLTAYADASGFDRAMARA